MREILFKGKRKDNDEWVEGDFVRLKDGDRVIPCIYGYGKVIHETVCEYTGKLDRNGKKIFENDICLFYGEEGETNIYTIAWDSNSCGYITRYTNSAYDVLDDFFAERCEVIGNIFDNPELLEDKQ